MATLMHLKPQLIYFARTALRHVAATSSRNRCRENAFYAVNNINYGKCSMVRNLCSHPYKPYNGEEDQENVKTSKHYSDDFKDGDQKNFILHDGYDEKIDGIYNDVNKVMQADDSDDPRSPFIPDKGSSEKITSSHAHETGDVETKTEDSIFCMDEDEQNLMEFYIYKKVTKADKVNYENSIKKMDIELLINMFENIETRHLPARMYWSDVIDKTRTLLMDSVDVDEIAKGVDFIRNILRFLEASDFDIDMLPIYSKTVRWIGDAYVKDCMKCPEDHQSLVYECHKKMLNISEFNLPYQDLIAGYLVTDQWQKVFEFFSLHAMTNVCDGPLLERLIIRLIEEGYSQTTDIFIQEYGKLLKTLKFNNNRKHFPPKHEFYKAFIKVSAKKLGNSIRKDSRKKDEIFSLKNMFSYMRQNRWIPTEPTADDISQYFHSSLTGNWSAKKGRILTKENKYSVLEYGHVCSVCQRPLGVLHYSNEEFQLLKDMTYRDMVIGDDIYNVSRPHDFQMMCESIMKHEKFDVVVDAENQIYVNQGGIKKSSKVLLQIIKMLTAKDMKVLVILKSYYGQNLIDSLSKMATVLTLDNSLVDDVHYIYAAMLSGPQTYILSKDLYRVHRAQMQTFQSIELFTRWQMARQLTTSARKRLQGNVEVFLHWPPATDPYPQVQKSNIHVPFHATDTTHAMGMPLGVLCIQKDS